MVRAGEFHSQAAAWPRALDAFLRTGGSRGEAWRALPRSAPFVAIAACGGLYGAVMASYYGFAGDRLLMVLYGGVKVPLLFVATMLIAVPFFYVLNLLLGAGDDFPAVWQGLVDYQLCVALQLAALIPVTAFVNLIYADYRLAQGWNTLLFAAAAWNSRRALAACYRPLIRKNPRHAVLGKIWFVLYAFVGVQMAWDLRPFVGHPTMPVSFFREDIGNAYVEITKILQLTLKSIMQGIG